MDSALISAAALVVGGLLGFLAAERTTRRTVAQAREQRRFERAQELRAETIPRLFVLLARVEEHTAWLLDLPGRATEQMRETMGEYLEGRLNKEQAEARELEWVQELDRELDAFNKQIMELKEFFLLHRIWLPDRLTVEFDKVMDGYDEHWPDLLRGVTNWAVRGQRFAETIPEDKKAIDSFLNQEKELYEASVRKMRNWFEGDRLRLEEKPWSIAREVLGVED
jgi:hypothetical protein